VKRLGGNADRRLEAFERDVETFGQRYGNVLLISRSGCPRFLAFCKAAGAGILGIDCFRLEQGQPVALLEPMADFSDLRASAIDTFRVESLRRARAFVDEMVEPDMWCEFVVDLPDSDDVMQSILRAMEAPSNNDMVDNSPNDPGKDPWAAVPIGVHLADTSPAGTYKIDGEGNCGPVSLGLVDMVWADLEPFGGTAGLNMEAVLYGLDAEDKAALHRTPVLAATREGETCHLPAVSLHRIDGSEFPAEVWSFPDMREGEVFGADVYVLDRSQPLKAALLVDTNAICRAASKTAQVFFFGRMDDKLRLEGTDLRLLLESSALWEAVTQGTDFAAAVEVRPFLGDPFRTHLGSRPIAAEGAVIGAALSIADSRTSELHSIDRNGAPNPAFERPSTVRGA